jgi:hypothetical protein
MNPFEPQQYFPRDSRHVFGHRFQVEPTTVSVRPYVYAGVMILALIAAVIL